MKELSKRSKKIVDNCIIKIYNNKLSIGEVYNKCVNYYGNSAFCYFIDELERLNMCYVSKGILKENNRCDWKN
jgi:hypothetical protein